MYWRVCSSVRPSVCPSVRQHFTGATLCGPDLRNILPFTLDNDIYRQLRCRRCTINLLFWPWHFSDLCKRSCKTFFFNFIPWMGPILCGDQISETVCHSYNSVYHSVYSPNLPICTVVPLVCNILSTCGAHAWVWVPPIHLCVAIIINFFWLAVIGRSRYITSTTRYRSVCSWKRKTLKIFPSLVMSSMKMRWDLWSYLLYNWLVCVSLFPQFESIS